MKSPRAGATASTTESAEPVVAVVIPCYRVAGQIEAVLAGIGPEVSCIYCVDDACPDDSGDIASRVGQLDGRIRVLRHEENTGVGGAVMTGYQAALEDGADVMVKIDGDGQMDPSLVPKMIAPILNGEADYTKGNRFFDFEGVRSMPLARKIGNLGLSFFSKFSTGYWNLFDPTNGYTAIHAKVVAALPLEKISKRFFFESDLLFRLNTFRAVVVDVPIPAKYADEKSNLSIVRALLVFPLLHTRNFFKRLFYNYFLRNFSFGSLSLLTGIGLQIFGGVFGILKWSAYAAQSQATPTGTIMIAALPIILGFQMAMNFVNYDMSSTPTDTIHRRL